MTQLAKAKPVPRRFMHRIRLTRDGSQFRGQHSDDGNRWKDLEGGSTVTHITHARPAVTQIEMNDPVHIGLAVTSHAGPAVTTEAKISNVTVTGNVEPTGEFVWSEDIGFQMIALPKE